MVRICFIIPNNIKMAHLIDMDSGADFQVCVPINRIIIHFGQMRRNLSVYFEYFVSFNHSMKTRQCVHEKNNF